MKNKFYSLFTVMFIAFNFLSCSDSVDNFDVLKEDLLGEWTMTAVNYSGTSTNTLQQGNPVEVFISGEGKNINSEMTFTDNPKRVFTSGSYELELTATSLGFSDTETLTINDFQEEASWSLDGNILTVDPKSRSMSYDGTITSFLANTEAQSFVIEELNDNFLRIRNIFNESTNESGISIELSMEVTMEFTR